jgi:hypothetical protein
MRAASPKKAALAAAVAGAAVLALMAGTYVGSRSDGKSGPARRFSVLADEEALDRGGSARAEGWAARLNARLDRGGEITALAVTRLHNGDEAGVATNGSDLCVADLTEGIGTCDNLSRAASGQIFVAIPGSCGSEFLNGYYVFGVIPDGVKNLTIDIGAEGVVNKYLHVVDNVYGVNLPPIETRLSDFSETFRVKLPLSRFASHKDAC